MNNSGMTAVRITAAYDCDICEDTKVVEMMRLGHDNEPRYSMEACICTIEDPNEVPIHIMNSGEAHAALRRAVLV